MQGLAARDAALAADAAGSRRRAAASGLVLLPALLVRLAIAWAPGEWLLRRVLVDDPFYYFTIARNLAHGRGLTFDGAAPTNGVHPLWVFLIAPILGAGSDPWLAIHLVLTLGAVLDVLALVLLLVLLRELEVRWEISLGIVVLQAFSPLLASPVGALNGLETAVNVLSILALLICYRRAVETPRDGRRLLWLAVACSGAFLARTDNAILILFAFGYLLWRARTDLRLVGNVVGAGLLASGLVAPWVLWSWVRFGSPVQVSGLAAAHVTHIAVELQGWGWRQYVGKAARNLATLAAYVPVGRGVAASLAGRAAANVVLIGGLLAAALWLARAAPRAERQSLRARLAPWWPLLVSGAAFVLVHTARAIELRTWYYASLIPIVMAVLALLADFVARRLASRSRPAARLIGASTIVACLAVLASGWRADPPGTCGELDHYRAIQTLNQTLSDGTRLGAWNAGVFGYFYRRGEVVDLDGLVDNAAYRHIVSRSLGAYAAERHLDYLLDADGAIELAEPYWDAGRPVSRPPPVWSGAASGTCRRMVLLPVMQNRS